jgi:hypothetical protein
LVKDATGAGADSVMVEVPGMVERIPMQHLKLEWEGPASTGGSEVQSFLVQMHPAPIGYHDLSTGQPVQPASHSFVEVYQGPLTKFQVPQLMPGTQYQVQLACQNMAGWSEFSRPAAMRTAAAAPGMPSAVKVAEAKTMLEGSLIINTRQDAH